jgi:hypothetical protein
VNDDADIRAVLERGAGPLTPVDPTEVRERAGRRRRRRQGAWALGIVVVLATVTVSLLVGGDEQARELDTVTTEPVSTTAPTTAPDPTATTALRWPPSRGSLPPFSGSPPPGWDEDGSLESQLVKERATGWTPIAVPEGVAFAPTEVIGSGAVRPPGLVTEVVDADLRLVGYWIIPVGYVDRVTFEDPNFDWRAVLRERRGSSITSEAEEEIAEIEAAGGLQDPIRIPEARR